MGSRLVPEVFDDLDHSAPAQPVHFMLHGIDYEIDLSELNKMRLEQELAPFVAVANVRAEGTGTGEQKDLVNVGKSPEVEEESVLDGQPSIQHTFAPVRVSEIATYTEDDAIDHEDYRSWLDENGWPLIQRYLVSARLIEHYATERVRRPRRVQVQGSALETAVRKFKYVQPSAPVGSNAHLRAWARSVGLSTGHRGPVSSSVRAAYRTAHNL